MNMRRDRRLNRVHWVIGTLLVFSVIYLPAHFIYAQWYARTWEDFLFYKLISDGIKDGDSLNLVEGKFQSKKSVPSSAVSQGREEYRWDVEKDDEFFEFVQGNHRIILQFRDGELVYHDLSVDLQSYQLKQAATPSQIEQRGLLPYYPLIAVVLAFIVWMLAPRSSTVIRNSDSATNHPLDA